MPGPGQRDDVLNSPNGTWRAVERHEDPPGRSLFCKTKRQFAQGGQLAFREEGARARRAVHACAQFSLLDSSDEIARRQVNDLDLVRQIKEPIWNGFTYRRPRNLGRSRAKALDVLHIQCREYIDTRSEQFEDVQISFGISASGDIAVRQLI